jgi:hypothetical protein
MYRSGSTFIFNVVRELLATQGSAQWVSTDKTAQAIEENNAKHLILKNHNPDILCQHLITMGAMKGICSVRNTYEVIESCIDVFGYSVDQCIELLRIWKNSFDKIKDCTLNINFSEIEHDPYNVIIDVSNYLDISISPPDATEIMQKFEKNMVMKYSNNLNPNTDDVVDIGFSYYDKNTLFHRRHVREKKMFHLNNAQKKYIDGHLSWQF